MSLKGSIEKFDREHKSGGKNKWWKPSPGRNRILIMPGYTNKEGKLCTPPWQVRGVHFEAPNGEPVTCPRATAGKDCRLCEAFFEAKDGKGPEEDTDTCKLSSYYLFNIIDYNDKGAGVQVWQCPHGMYTTLREMMDDPDEFNMNGPKSWMLHNPVVQFTLVGKGKRTKYSNVKTIKKVKMKLSEFQGKFNDLRSIARQYMPSYKDTCRAYDGKSLKPKDGDKKGKKATSVASKKKVKKSKKHKGGF